MYKQLIIGVMHHSCNPTGYVFAFIIVTGMNCILLIFSNRHSSIDSVWLGTKHLTNMHAGIKDAFQTTGYHAYILY